MIYVGGELPHRCVRRTQMCHASNRMDAQAVERLARIGAFTAIAAVAFACTSERNTNATANAISHPVADSLESSRSDARVVLVSIPGSVSIPPQLQPLGSFPSDSIIGALEGPSDSVFGSVVDAVLVGDSAVVLLDAQSGVVRLAAPSSTSIRTFGGFGPGPGEFVEPVTAFATGNGQVAVVDAEGRKIHTIDLASAKHTSLPLPLFPHDACELNGRLFVLGPLITTDTTGSAALASKTLVHEIDRSGAVLRSFSIPYRFTNPILAYTYGNGRLACDGSRNRLWAAYSVLGEIHALQPDGKLDWIARLTDLTFPAQIETGTRIGSDPAGTLLREHITNISLISREILAVQVQSRRRPNVQTRKWEFAQRTYLLDAETGVLVSAIEADHEIIGGGAGRAVLYRSQPYPRIRIVQLEKKR